MIEIRSVSDLLSALEAESPDAEMFRGQSQDWSLLPSIGRYPEIVIDYEDWRTLHVYLIERFLRLGRPFFGMYPESDMEACVLAQHHGMPTSLIDTSTNPLKALFFAVQDSSKDDVDGIFWAFSYTSWSEELEAGSAEAGTAYITPFVPPQLNPRLTTQEGAFICYPLPTNTNPLYPLDDLVSPDFSSKKYSVPCGVKSRLRRELMVLGVESRLLFPDLDGVARSIVQRELLP